MAQLFLYLLSQEENTGYDTYDSCVVAAENEEDAKSITPNGKTFKEAFSKHSYSEGWARTSEGIHCMLIGVAAEGIPRGVICASFNAG